jgi:dihydrofolate reductase
VLTRDEGFSSEGVHVTHTWEGAVAKGQELAAGTGADAIAVAGGAEIYALALPHVQALFLTEVHASPEGDAIFPPFDRSQFREVKRENHPKGPDDEHPFTFIDLERRR